MVTPVLKQSNNYETIETFLKYQHIASIVLKMELTTFYSRLISLEIVHIFTEYFVFVLLHFLRLSKATNRVCLACVWVRFEP